MARVPPNRRTKGVNLIGIVKLLRTLRKQRPLVGLSSAAEGLLAENILISDWYPFDPFMELIALTYRELLDSNEDRAREMGIAGGRLALSGFHKQFVKLGDTEATLLAMRHSWTSYFDFGELTVALDGARGVRFTIDGYPDMPACHGQLIVGWHIAAALESGAANAKSELLERPWWSGGKRLVHRVTY